MDPGCPDERRTWLPSATLLPDGQVRVLGGGPDQTSAELYDPTNNTWTYTGSLNVGRVAQTATLVSQGQVVVAGGDASDYNGPPLGRRGDLQSSGSVQLFYSCVNTHQSYLGHGGDFPWFTENHAELKSLTLLRKANRSPTASPAILNRTVPADGQVFSFNWKVSSEDGYDFLTFYINGYEHM